MPHRITLLPGDGIGPEVTEAARRVLEASGAAIEWDVQLAGAATLESAGTPLPPTALDSIRANTVALKGPIATPIGGGYRSVNVALRQTLDLFANLRPVRSYRGIQTPFDDVDLILVRENTEDLYVGIEHKVGDTGAVGIKITTRAGSERIARFAFETAAKQGRKKVTAVHKASVMHASDGLFLAASRRIAGRYHGLEYEEVAVDNLAARMIRRPRDFDVLLMPNLYGDIFSDLCAGLVGGLGVAPGANIGEAAAVFEAVHGTAPDIAGQNKANPTATILSGVMLLEHIGEFAAAARVRGALEGVLVEGWAVTRDLGGESTTSGMADAVIKRLAETASQQPNALDAAHRVVDLPRVAALAERAGVVWRAGLAQQQLALHRYEPGGGTTSFINPEADEVLVILEGEGVLEVAGERYSLHPGHVASVPRGARRQVRAGAERLVYVAVRPA